MFPKIGVPQNGWFIRENPIKMDDLGGPPLFFVIMGASPFTTQERPFTLAAVEVSTLMMLEVFYGHSVAIFRLSDAAEVTPNGGLVRESPPKWP